MDRYLSLLKGSPHKEGQVDITYKHWPTYLNTAIKKGRAWYTKCIDETNYLLTAQMYTSTSHKTYADWLVSLDFTDKKELLCQMAAFSTSACFLDRYPSIYEKNSYQILVASVATDNFSVFPCIYRKITLGEEQFLDLLKIGLKNKAKNCVQYLIKDLLKTEPRSLGKDIWQSLHHYNDHCAVEALKSFLSLTPPDENSGICAYLKIIMTGTAEQVAQKTHCHDMYLLITHLANRVPYDESLADVVYDLLVRFNLLNDDWVCSYVASSILSSKRDSQQTDKIIRSLNKKNIIFNDRLGFDFSKVSVESWNSIIKTQGIFDYDKIFIGNDPQLEDVKLLLPENEELRHDIFSAIDLSSTSPEITDIFLLLGTSISFWGYHNGFINKLSNPETTMIAAARNGNIFMFSLALEELDVITDPNLAKHFMDLCLHRECMPLLNARLGASYEQEIDLVNGNFVEHFWDTSVVCNRNGYISKYAKTNWNPRSDGLEDYKVEFC